MDIDTQFNSIQIEKKRVLFKIQKQALFEAEEGQETAKVQNCTELIRFLAFSFFVPWGHSGPCALYICTLALIV